MENLRAIEIYNDVLSDGRRRLIAIESVEFEHSKADAGCQLYGHIEPLAVIVCTQDGIHILDLDSNKISLDKLRQDIPELEDLIASFITQ